MSGENRESRDRSIEESIQRATQPTADGGGIKPPDEESLHDIVQRKMRERAEAAARKRRSHGPSSSGAGKDEENGPSPGDDENLGA
jgi:hypothetical protein